jgi:predicted dehydrogenase
VGTGPWARMTHASALAGSSRVRFTAIWGRSLPAAAELAADFSTDGQVVDPFSDFYDFLGAVDLVVFSVPPSVQERLALVAAREGKHVLLEKPIARELSAGRALVAAIDREGAGAYVFLTQQYDPAFRKWCGEQAARGGWRGGHVQLFTSLMLDRDNPFSASPWRQEDGAWWDAAPHHLATLILTLGRVDTVEVARGPGDLTDAILWHASGIRSTLTLGFDIAGDARSDLWLLSGTGEQVSPPDLGEAFSAADASRRAVEALVDEGESGERSPYPDAALGLHILEVLSAGELSIARQGRMHLRDL